MPMDIVRRLEHFDQELDPAGPEAWTLAQLEAAHKTLLDELDARRFHCKVAEGYAQGGSFPPSGAPALRHWLQAGLGRSLHEARHGMTPALARCYLQLARARLRAGDAPQAVLALERVLRQNPLHAEARALLEPLAGQDPAARDLAEGTRLRHVRSFGRSRLKLPVSALPLPGGRILVADHLSPHLFVFTLGGRLVRTLPMGLKMPCILAAEADDRFLICDRDNRRLVRFDLEGNILGVLPVRLCDGGRDEMLPLRAFPMGGRLLVAAVNAAMDTLTLGEMTPEGFAPLHVFARFPLSLHRMGARIAVRDFGTGRVDLFDPQSGAWTPLPLDLPRLAHHYALAAAPGGDLFLDIQGTGLARFDAQGKMVYILQLHALFGSQGMILELRHYEGAALGNLLAVDAGNRCIHIFDTGLANGGRHARPGTAERT